MTWKNVMTRFFEPFFALILLVMMLVCSSFALLFSGRFRRFVKGKNRQPGRKLSGSLPYDKLLHLLAGVVVVAVTFWFVGVWSFLVAVIAGVGKEVYDYVEGDTKEDVEVADALATVLGGLLATLLLVVLCWS